MTRKLLTYILSIVEVPTTRTLSPLSLRAGLQREAMGSKKLGSDLAGVSGEDAPSRQMAGEGGGDGRSRQRLAQRKFLGAGHCSTFPSPHPYQEKCLFLCHCPIIAALVLSCITCTRSSTSRLSCCSRAFLSEAPRLWANIHLFLPHLFLFVSPVT